LRSMSTGASLYQQIFYSQPPFFLLSIYPFYALLGQTIWSARLGIAIISLFGLLGALLLGRALAGRLGMLLALLLLVINPLYLAESQILQADAPSTALTLLAVGLAYLWWERPNGMVKYCLAMLAATTLALSILTKLLAAPALAPVILLALAPFKEVKKQTPVKRFVSMDPLFLGCIAFVLTTLLLLLPFRHAFSQFWQTVVTFHTDAKTYFLDTQSGNSTNIGSLLESLLSASALYGTVIALLRRDWRVIPLLVWLVATIYLLWQQVPLFLHHSVVLIPPLIALAVMGVAPITRAEKRPRLLVGHLLRLLPLKTTFASKKPAFLKVISKATHPLVHIATVITIILALCQIVSNIQPIRSLYDSSYLNAHSQSTQPNIHVIHDLQRFTKQDQLVITDAQFIAAQAGRSTPASLVDTSDVRIFTNYVTTQQLIEEASQPQVQVVLFYTDRLDMMLPSFYNWVSQHFHLAYRYGSGEELWVKNP
ncbi:MAG TPA: glycosyltransferase family 39 protein, partial [Ktedonobacteraceae bacterium]|nr:glycosyltransferase family 39 protein [Ktedonobacteraceae bacterium]